ncbi:MAG: 5-demethoxyubiquinol-8 5-hydroxylase UbiM [Xanthomonadales bacterium]|nr:5-demethoxyubiquinol-8 5-hydroxylase UbiM [Xanthomonadales bacterium]
MSDIHDILIIGAGPAGLSLAGVLARQGLAVCIADPGTRESLAQPLDDGREIALTPLSRQLLEDWGQWPLLGSDEFARLREAQVFDGDSTEPMRVSTPQGAAALGWMASNHALRRVAYAVATAQEGIDWRLGRKVVEVRNEATHAQVTLDDGTLCRARLVVAADSRFSSSRRAAGIAARHRDFGRSMLVCRMRLEKPQPGIAWEWLAYGQTLALLPLQHDLASVVITLPPADIAGLQSLSPEAFNDEVARHYAHRLGAMHLVGERHVYPLVGVAPERLVAERFACIGDAAIGMHPITAHGYNLGLRGIALLADRILLAQRRGRDFAAMDVLVDFERDLRAIAQPLYLATLSVVHLYGDDRPLMRVLRRALLRVAEHAAPFRMLLTAALAGRETRPPMPLRLIARLAAVLPGRSAR